MSSLRKKLLISLGFLASFSMFQAAYCQEFIELEDQSKAMMVTPRDTKWLPAPPSLPPGAEMLVLEGNPASPGPFTMRLKFPPNYQLPAHWHFSDEHITLISGTLSLGLGNTLDLKKGKALSMGSYARIPAKMHYYAWTNEEETVIQLHGIGPWGFNYVETMDEPKK